MSDFSTLGFHKGKMMMHIAKSTYNTLLRVVVECVQNAIDANARHIWILVDMPKRTIVVTDDGDGVSPADFQKALMSVGSGIKEKSKLGRFGLGLISPLDKCEQFTFTSQARGSNEAYRWTFKAQDIAPQEDSIRIPRTEVKSLVDNATQGQMAKKTWRTAMRIRSFSKDSEMSAMDPDTLEQSIQSKLGPALRKTGVTCSFMFTDLAGHETDRVVKPLDYNGTPLEVIAYDETDAGIVEFTLYQAVRTRKGYKGQISIMEMDASYPITWREFELQSRGWLSEETRKALGSGFFEGVIRCKRIELHPSRNKFVRNDALVGLCVTIEKWFEDVGRQIYLDDRQQARESRYQQLGHKSLERMGDMLRLPQFKQFRDGFMNTVQIGTLGDEHNLPRQGEVEDTDGDTGIRVSKVGGSSEPVTKTEPPTKTGKDNPDDVPLVSYGPRGPRRKPIRNDSIGLGISHYPLDEASNRLWDFDVTYGVVHFNPRHPIWIKCDEQDKHIEHLQNWMIMQILTMLTMPETMREAHRDFIDRQVSPYVEIMVLQPNADNRRRTKA